MAENKNTQYSPISCSYYDELEALATKKTETTIVYKEGTDQKTIEDIILTFEIKDGAEFLITKKGKSIRLDMLITVNGLPLKNNKYC